MSFRHFLWFLVFAPAGLALAAAPSVERLPIESFFRTPEISSPHLSQDGTRVVFLVRNYPARRSVAVYDVKAQKGGIVFVPTDYDVDFAFWKGDRIVLGGDAGGNESFSLRSIKADGSDLRDLNESAKKYRPVDGPAGGRLYSRLPDDPENVLVAGFGVRRDQAGRWESIRPFGFYRLNVVSGKRILVEAWTERATGYFLDDRTGRIYARTLQSGPNQILEMKSISGEYRRVGEYKGSSLPYEFVGLLPGEKEAVVIARDTSEARDRGLLGLFDREQVKEGKALYAPPQGEITRIHRDRLGRIVGVSYEGEKELTDWFDPQWARSHASLTATFPGQTVSFVDSTDDAMVHIVYVRSDRDEGAFYLFNAAAPSIVLLGRLNPKIDPKLMAARRPIHYTARDGLEIHGYLTLPLGREQQKNPLILLPHGGPFGPRDSWEFDPDSQFLANRGYAVLQVNFRGSGGYGVRFLRAGYRQWGRKMQDDLTDAVGWAVKEGITAPDQVAIYGASYGGYAALAGLVFTPELYRCGINYVGVTDLRMLVRPNEGAARGEELFYDERIGTDMNELRDRSPVEHVADIRVPTLHAYGENDPRVDIAQWHALERELKKHGKSYLYIHGADEGHGFGDEAKSREFYGAMEKFLAENLPVPTAN